MGLGKFSIRIMVMGERASLKDQSLLLGAMMKMLTSPQVEIAAMRQLGSCIIV